MKYNFDEIIDRSGTNSLKWDIKDGELPMWVADMDFKTAPQIIDAINKRVANGIYGYSIIPDEWTKSYVSWWERRHSFKMNEENLVFCTGVIPALSTAVRKLTTPAEKVIVFTPVYNMFFNSIVNNGRVPVQCQLTKRDGHVAIDFDSFEKVCKDPQVSLLFMCNPQNPIGAIWDKDTLAKVGEICNKYGITVISDEIHCDIVEPGNSYIPFASVNDVNANISVTCIAPTKCFNIAGVQSAAIYAKNPQLRHKMWRGLNTDEVGEPNFVAIQAAIAAFNEGEEWLNELNEYIGSNKQLVRNFVKDNISDLKDVSESATYLSWIDASAIMDKFNKVNADNKYANLAEYIRKTTGLYLSSGTVYGIGGENYLRLNVACPKSVVKDGLNRLKTSIEKIG